MRQPAAPARRFFTASCVAPGTEWRDNAACETWFDDDERSRHLPVSPACGRCRMSGRAPSAGRAGCDRLRRFAICLLLLVFGALTLHGPLHAGPALPGAGHQQVSVMAGHCPDQSMASGHGTAAATDCANAEGSANSLDCCQSCPVATVPFGPPDAAPTTKGEVFALKLPDLLTRSPDSILRPPRPVAA